MFPVVENELKYRIRKNSGVREIAHRIGLPYGTLAAKLNGFSPIYESERIAIENALNDVVLKKEKSKK